MRKRRKEVHFSRRWPKGVRFEDAESVERRTIQRVVPHAAERESFLGNSSLLCVDRGSDDDSPQDGG